MPDALIERQTAKQINRKSFDAIEGEGTNYTRTEIAVRLTTGEVVTAITYRVRDPRPELKTNLEYVGYIVTGLRERNVSEKYITEVKRLVASNNPAIAAQVERL